MSFTALLLSNQATRHARLPGWEPGRFPFSLELNQATRHTEDGSFGASEATPQPGNQSNQATTPTRRPVARLKAPPKLVATTCSTLVHVGNLSPVARLDHSLIERPVGHIARLLSLAPSARSISVAGFARLARLATCPVAFLWPRLHWLLGRPWLPSCARHFI